MSIRNLKIQVSCKVQWVEAFQMYTMTFIQNCHRQSWIIVSNDRFLRFDCSSTAKFLVLLIACSCCSAKKKRKDADSFGTFLPWNWSCSENICWWSFYLQSFSRKSSTSRRCFSMKLVPVAFLAVTTWRTELVKCSFIK